MIELFTELKLSLTVESLAIDWTTALKRRWEEAAGRWFWSPSPAHECSWFVMDRLSITNMTLGELREIRCISRTKVSMKKSSDMAETHSQIVEIMCKVQPPSLPLPQIGKSTHELGWKKEESLRDLRPHFLGSVPWNCLKAMGPQIELVRKVHVMMRDKNVRKWATLREFTSGTILKDITVWSQA